MPSRGCWPRTAPVALAAVPRASISASAHDGAAPASAAPLLLFAAATVRRRCCSGPALKFATNAMGVRHMPVQGGTEGKKRREGATEGERACKERQQRRTIFLFAPLVRQQPWAFLRKKSKLQPDPRHESPICPDTSKLSFLILFIK